MNILTEVKTLITTLNIQVETGVFKKTAPDTYIVLVPLSDSFPLSADDKPIADEQELRITLYSKINYQRIKNQIVNLLISNFFCITDRRFNGYETGTGYYQYTIDVAKNYTMEELN